MTAEAENPDRVKRVTDALLARPALAAAVARDLHRLIFADPWEETEDEHSVRTMRWGQTSTRILAIVHLKEITPPSVSFDERWVAQVFNPRRGGPPKMDEFESREQAMDEADSLLQGMGVVLIDEDDDE